MRKEIKKLTHDAHNPHSDYTYVSIDTYYQQVVPKATEAGLVWRTRETAMALLPDMGRNKDRFYVSATFAFDLYCGGAEAKDWMTTTIVLPFEGAQTTGQAFSYADKVFMRVAFGIATGEKDADAQKAETVQSTSKGVEKPKPPTPPHDPVTGELKPAVASPPQSATTVGDILNATAITAVSSSTNETGDPVMDPRKVPHAGPQMVYDVFRLWMPKIKTYQQLLDWHTESRPAIEKVQAISPEIHEQIKTLFREKRAVLEKGQSN